MSDKVIRVMGDEPIEKTVGAACGAVVTRLSPIPVWIRPATRTWVRVPVWAVWHVAPFLRAGRRWVFSGYSGFLPLFKIITDADN